MADNTLYYGDNLDILRRYIAAESIDLVYLDPPFNSNATYNVLFAEQNGSRAASQIKAFEDTWQWDLTAAQAYQEVVEAGGKVSQALQALRTFLGDSNLLAYLAMMAPRLMELCRVLKPTGSIYLHCDPTASHYLKMLMDAVFEARFFRNEIIWKRVYTVKGNFGQGSRFFGPNTDAILFYSKTEDSKFTALFTDYSEDYIRKFFRFTESDGRRYRLISMIGPGGASKGNPHYEFLGVTRYWRYSREKMQELYGAGMIVQTQPGTVPQRKQYLDAGRGVAVQSLWDDIPALSASSAERLGYPTQKPEALLDRIIQASSNEGDTVLDPFCGCGTAIASAQRLGRRWIGIDITYLAISLIKSRLATAWSHYPADQQPPYEVIGEPESLPDAKALAETDPYQFQWWALDFVGARPAEQKKGADKGIDGRLYFHDDGTGGETKQAIFSVKAGHTDVSHVRELRAVVDRERAQIGVLLTMQEPTKPMRTEAASFGFYQSHGTQYPRLQLLTIEELLAGKRVDMPPWSEQRTFKVAPKAQRESRDGQGRLWGRAEPESSKPRYPSRPHRRPIGLDNPSTV